MRPIVLLFTSALLVGCGAVVGDSSTPTPVDTPTPVASPTPTSTPTPAPSPTPEYCSTSDGERVSSLLDDFADRWDDAFELAASTPRMNLPPQIAALQEIRRDVTRQEWPDCADTAHTELVASMDKYIDAFLAFMTQKPEAEVQKLFDDGRRHQDAFFRELRLMSR